MFEGLISLISLISLIVVYLKVGEAPYFIIALPSVKSTSKIPTRSP